MLCRASMWVWWWSCRVEVCLSARALIFCPGSSTCVGRLTPVASFWWRYEFSKSVGGQGGCPGIWLFCLRGCSYHLRWPQASPSVSGWKWRASIWCHLLVCATVSATSNRFRRCWSCVEAVIGLGCNARIAVSYTYIAMSVCSASAVRCEDGIN